MNYSSLVVHVTDSNANITNVNISDQWSSPSSIPIDVSMLEFLSYLKLPFDKCCIARCRGKIRIDTVEMRSCRDVCWEEGREVLFEDLWLISKIGGMILEMISSMISRIYSIILSWFIRHFHFTSYDWIGSTIL